MSCSISNLYYSESVVPLSPGNRGKSLVLSRDSKLTSKVIFIYLSLYTDRSKNNTGFSASLSFPLRAASWARIRLRQAYDWKVKDHRSGFSYIIWRTFPPLFWDVVSSGGQRKEYYQRGKCWNNRLWFQSEVFPSVMPTLLVSLQLSICIPLAIIIFLLRKNMLSLHTVQTKYHRFSH